MCSDWVIDRFTVRIPKRFVSVQCPVVHSPRLHTLISGATYPHFWGYMPSFPGLQTLISGATYPHFRSRWYTYYVYPSLGVLVDEAKAPLILRVWCFNHTGRRIGKEGRRKYTASVRHCCPHFLHILILEYGWEYDGYYQTNDNGVGKC